MELDVDGDGVEVEDGDAAREVDGAVRDEREGAVFPQRRRVWGHEPKGRVRNCLKIRPDSRHPQNQARLGRGLPFNFVTVEYESDSSER